MIELFISENVDQILKFIVIVLQHLKVNKIHFKKYVWSCVWGGVSKFHTVKF